MKKALIIGATGLVGNHCLEKLLEDPAYDKVIALTRKKINLNHPKLENHTVDFDKKESWSKYCVADDVFSAMGTTIGKAGSKDAFYKIDFTYPFEIAKEAKAAGAKRHVLVSAMGANKNSLIFYNRVKGEIEKAITDLNFETNVILRPSLLIGERKESRPMEKASQQFFNSIKNLLPDSFANSIGIDAATVAKGMIHFMNDGLKGNRIFSSKEIYETIKAV